MPIKEYAVSIRALVLLEEIEEIITTLIHKKCCQEVNFHSQKGQVTGM